MARGLRGGARSRRAIRLGECLLTSALALAPEELRIALDVSAVFGGHVVVEIDRCHGTLGDARAAVDALIGIDEHLDAGEAGAAFAFRNRSQLVERDGANDAVAGADVDACGVTGSDALLGDDVGHALA